MPVIEPPLPRTTPLQPPPKGPVEKPVFTRGTVTANAPGVIVTVSPEVEWMRKNGIL